MFVWEENEFVWPFDTLKYRLSTSPKSFFQTPRKQIMSYQGHSPTGNHLSNFAQVTFFDAQDTRNEFELRFHTLKHRLSTSPKSFFKTPRRQIMSSQGHSPT
jgi:hypothetical protein